MLLLSRILNALLTVCIFVDVIFCHVIVVKHASSPPDMSDTEDVSKITWAHAVNSRKALEEALSGDVNFIEADISLGQVVGRETANPRPIMAHPPETTSDIAAEHWLDLVIARNTGKGIKLDFKQIESVEPTLEILSKHSRKLSFPLWLNADILPGPVNSTATPVSAQQFLKLCNAYFSNATLSVGWTTFWYNTFPPDTWYYGWNHVRAMADALKCSGIEDSSLNKLTFPVRAVFVPRSIRQLQWIVQTFPSSTLTVWSGNYDAVNAEDLLKIRESFKISEVYYDVPQPLRQLLDSKRSQEKLLQTREPAITSEWINVHPVARDNDCSSQTYISDRTLMFGKNIASSVIMKDSFIVADGKQFKAEGYVHFYSSGNDGTSVTAPATHKLVLVLSSASVLHDASSALIDDAIWDSLNSSMLHVFQHDFSLSPSSCHYFRLDTAGEMAFQAWTLPCEVLLDGLPIEETLKHGKSVVPSRRRLVLPSREVAFGFLSSGSGHVVVHDLNITGEKTATSGANYLLGFSSMIAFSALFVMLM